MLEEDAVSQFINKIVTDNQVLIGDKDSLKEKLIKILKDQDNLTVITDYDATLTDYWLEEGVKQFGGHDIPLSSKRISNEFKLEKINLEKKYSELLSDLNLKGDEKEKIVESWFEEVHELFIKENLNKDDIDDIVFNFTTKFRNYVDDFFTLCNESNIPVLVVSAGLQDIIELMLEKYNFNSENVKVRGNKMNFSIDPPHKLESFGTTIHMLNKNNLKVEGDVELESFKTKSSCLVLGDSLGDAKMAHPFNIANVIKIGFVTFDLEKLNLLQTYVANFDLVFIGTAGFEYINDIIKLAQK